SYHGFLSLGKLAGNAIISNNLLVDHFALGNDSDAVRQAEFSDSRELDQWGAPRMTWVIAVPDTAGTINYSIENNYYRVTPACQSFYDSASFLPIVANPPLTVGSPLTYNINSRLGADSATAFRLTTTDLLNTPELMVEFCKWYRRPWTASDSGGNKQKVRTGWVQALHDYDRRLVQYYTDTLDCSYSTSADIYTAATGGYPVGDLNWFPDRYTAWKNDPTVGVDDTPGATPESYALSQNYPNPFNPSTTIKFELPAASLVRLSVFDLLGREVSVLVNEQRSAGVHDVTFDAGRLASGVYLYRLQAGDFVQAHKMVLLK
ncbi:MAG: T9SS type A sorting domain-containing protein, partial [Bacteroidetes bacterium]|nr:T9SS type A sorting domain-containing protein [Bacteroidota bacterium]